MDASDVVELAVFHHRGQLQERSKGSVFRSLEIVPASRRSCRDSCHNAPMNRLVKEDRLHGASLLQDNDFLQGISRGGACADHDVFFLRENGDMIYSLLIHASK